MAESPDVTSGTNAGWFDDAQAVTRQSSLREHYRTACKDLRRARRAIKVCLNTRRLPVLKEELKRARLHVAAVESEVKKCWSINGDRGRRHEG